MEKINKKYINKFHDIKYYENMEFFTLNKEYIEQENRLFDTKKQEDVTKYILKKNKEISKNGVFDVLKGIYNKNINYHFHQNSDSIPLPFNSDLTNIIANIPLLLNSYAKIRKNKGGITTAAQMNYQTFKNLNVEQKRYIINTGNAPDEITYKLFETISKLIKKGKYPWGASRRIYIDKPGKKNIKRPITIPPFMDRVVQDVIKNTLLAIYEPHFDKLNCSFGFRPNKSVHDAIYSLTNNNTIALNIAIEGDIKAAYDNVNINILINILRKKIKDEKFLKLLRDRLEYEYLDTQKDQYIKDNKGIPQGGSDSPYLWNIYMLEFDEYVKTEIKEFINTLNENSRGINSDNKEYVNNDRIKLYNQKISIKKILIWILKNKNIKNKNIITDLKILYKEPVIKWKSIDPIFKGPMVKAKECLKICDIENENDIEKIIQNISRLLRKTNHKMINLPYYNVNKIRYRLAYARYADDWIILTNAKMEIAKTIKEKLANFLKDKLQANLSEEKTLITKIDEKPAKFLGFEIKTYKTRKVGKYMRKHKDKIIKVNANIAGNKVFAVIDKKRQIERMHMKGYCDKNGEPTEIPKLVNLEAFTIIEKYNSVLSGLCYYYNNYIRNPKAELSRWIYILRHSCLKTLAQKHKTTVRNIFKKYKPEIKDPKEENTIEAVVKIKMDNEIWSKKWKLHTRQSLWKNNMKWDIYENKIKVEKSYWKLEQGSPIKYEEINKIPSPIHNNYVNRSEWVSKRTQSSFDLPCCICGSYEIIEMHHLKHVRKTKYNKINKENTWEQVMGLKNRKQIPVCRECHMNFIHKGNYGGKKLSTLVPRKMYDNRIITIESHIHSGDKSINYKKSLYEKGWRKYKGDELIP